MNQPDVLFERGFLLFKIERILALLVAVALSAVSAPMRTQGQSQRQPDAPHRFPLRAYNYDLEVIVHPQDSTISAQAKVDFVADEVAKTLLVELHSDLHLNSVKSANGQPLAFERDVASPLLLSVALPSTVTPGTKVSVTFDYSGPVSSDEASPTKGVRFASVDKTSAYLLLPSRWFPLTNYPSNRYTGTFRVIVPDGFTVAGTGKVDPPTMMPGLGKGLPGQSAYVFHCDQAAPVGSFVAGSLQMSPVQTEGYQFSIYTPAAQAATATAYANSLAHIMSSFSDSFGPIENATNLAVAQMPDGSLQGFSAPGILFVSARQWTTKANDEILSQLAAGQWWGDRVLAASPADTWLTDGLTTYSGAMYAEQSDGVAGLHKMLEEYAIGALMYESTTTIAQADHLGLYSPQYRSIVSEKGALVFHMLRSELGDDAFTAVLHEFYKEYDGKTATIDDFEKVTATKVPAAPKDEDAPFNLLSFFAQWLNSTGVPEFTMTYTTYRTPKGFKVVGKIKQDLDTFRMPVEIRVETEGNPETKKVLVEGTTSDFEIDTFGRPKPQGITIDPNNNLLKSSPHLRVRAAVARGESLAEVGKYYEAIVEYQHALDVQANNSLAQFRMGEAMFYQKNYQAGANSFRSALGGDLDPKWVEVWSHIYIGKIYDLLGQRERAVNEYSLAQHKNDNTAGAQEEAARYIQKPYTGDASQAATASAGTISPGAPAASATPAAASGPDTPTLKRRTN